MQAFRSTTHAQLSRTQAKQLLGALSCCYDDRLREKGLDPSVLRQYPKGLLEPLPLFMVDSGVLKHVTYNLFHIHKEEEWWKSAGGTPDNSEEFTLIGFKVHDLCFTKVQLTFCTSGHEYLDDSHFTLDSKEAISPYEVFQTYGTALFEAMAVDGVAWESLIRALAP